MLETEETSQARRQRYLRAAGEAGETAAQATDQSVRERYLKLEQVWLTLAAHAETHEDYERLIQARASRRHRIL
jgi:hypothetical protein